MDSTERPVAVSYHGLLALLRLVSPTLPVGGYSYSRGLEQAVERGWVCDEPSTASWIGAYLEHCAARMDAPAVYHVHGAFVDNDSSAVARWAALLGAMRESAELLAEDRNMGEAFARLLTDLGYARVAALRAWQRSFPILYALAAVEWGVPAPQAVAGYFFWLAEGQVSAALRLVPLGQTAGQRILERLVPEIPRFIDTAMHLDEQEIGGFLPGLALASALHESQYSRLFRS